MARDIGQPLKCLTQITLAVGKNDVSMSVRYLGEGLGTREHGVSRSLRGERKNDAVDNSGIKQPPSIGQCCFCLAAASGRFNKRESGGDR